MVRDAVKLLPVLRNVDYFEVWAELRLILHVFLMFLTMAPKVGQQLVSIDRSPSERNDAFKRELWRLQYPMLSIHVE